MIWSFTPVQTPSDLLHFPGDSIRVNCSHQYGKTFNKIFWYRQRATHDLHLLGVLTFEESVLDNPHYNFSGDAEHEPYLEVTAVNHEYSAVYFCALNDGSTMSWLVSVPLQKNISPWSCDFPAPVKSDFSTPCPHNLINSWFCQLDFCLVVTMWQFTFKAIFCLLWCTGKLHDKCSEVLALSIPTKHTS